MTQLEKEIQADIVKLLETVGAAVYKIGTKRKKGDHQGTMQTPWYSGPARFCAGALGMGSALDRSEAAWRNAMSVMTKVTRFDGTR